MCSCGTVDAEISMIPDDWRQGEIAIIGLGRSGAAATRFLSKRGLSIYASDSASSAQQSAAAESVTDPRVTVELGGHDLQRIRNAALVVCSPGVPLDAAPLVAARGAGVEIFAELDLAAMFLDDTNLIVVTGTNGKTTTTALIQRILTEGGVFAEVAGNIGRPLIEIAEAGVRPEWVVVEASSFQLHDARHLRPRIGVVTNLSPDHLDRYASAAEYYDDKRRLFHKASEDSTWILNGDDPEVLSLVEGVPGQRRLWSLEQQADAWYDDIRKCLELEKDNLLERNHLALMGDHNVSNALAAALAASAVGVERSAIARGLRSFAPLPHRLEPISVVGGVTWINDSKATNVASVSVALAAMDRRFSLVAGGRPKGESFVRLGELLRQQCTGVAAYGEARSTIEEQIGQYVTVRSVLNFEEAVHCARAMVRNGEAVLLSPGCSSFDQFANYEHRGESFRQLAKAK